MLNYLNLREFKFNHRLNILCILSTIECMNKKGKEYENKKFWLLADFINEQDCPQALIEDK